MTSSESTEPLFLLPQAFLQKKVVQTDQELFDQRLPHLSRIRAWPNWTSYRSLCRVFLGSHKCLYEYIRWMVREYGAVLRWGRGIGRIRQRSIKGMNIIVEKEFRRRIQSEPSNQILNSSFFQSHRLWASVRTHTWKSIECPSVRRALAIFNACCACLSKLSKSVTWSLVKKGRVIDRWNLTEDSLNMYLLEMRDTITSTCLLHSYENEQIIGKNDLKHTVWIKNSTSQQRL